VLIENSFDVDADPDRVFTFLQNPHNVATCFPGAELTEDLGDDSYRGKVKIKLGPVTAAFSGVAKITEKDDVARVAVLVAEGKDARGSGTAKATATMRVEPKDSGSNVLLTTDLTISGKLAQFGRGIMADVSARMVDDLAVRVRERIEGEPADAATAEAAKTAEAAEAAKTATAETTAAAGTTPEAVSEAPAETTAATDGKGDAPAEAPTETPAASSSESTTAAGAPAETPAASTGNSKTVAEAPAGAPAETATATASGSTSEEAAGADSGVVSGATTETATAAATAKPAAEATPAASSEPAGAIKATTLVKVMVAGMIRRLFARLRGRSSSS
jgi:carbon monoxide dehydrogenase subunit G